MQLAIFLTVQISDFGQRFIEIWRNEEAYMCSPSALSEAPTKHSDDCCWVWVMNDTPIALLEAMKRFVFLQVLLSFLLLGTGHSFDPVCAYD